MRVESSLTWPTVRRREANGNRKTVQPFVLVLKGETDRRKAKEFRAFPPVYHEGAKTVTEGERKKRTQKRCGYFRRSLRRGQKRSGEDTRKEHENAINISAGLQERAKPIEREGKKHVAERRGGKAVSLAVCPTVN